MSEELLNKQSLNDVKESRRARLMPSMVVVLEQMARGAIHMVQFAASYVVMLLVMYSNGMFCTSVVGYGSGTCVFRFADWWWLFRLYYFVDFGGYVCGVYDVYEGYDRIKGIWG